MFLGIPIGKTGLFCRTGDEMCAKGSDCYQQAIVGEYRFKT